MSDKRSNHTTTNTKKKVIRRSKSSGTQTLTTPSKVPIVAAISILLVLVVSAVVIIALTGTKSTKKVTTAKIAYSLESCSLISGNARISCVAGASELTGYRYASANWNPAPLSWTEYWRINGFPSLTIVDGGFGKNPKSWWEKEPTIVKTFLTVLDS